MAERAPTDTCLHFLVSTCLAFHLLTKVFAMTKEAEAFFTINSDQRAWSSVVFCLIRRSWWSIQPKRKEGPLPRWLIRESRYHSQVHEQCNNAAAPCHLSSIATVVDNRRSHCGGCPGQSARALDRRVKSRDQPDGIPRRETFCLRDESKAAGFGRLVTSEVVRRKLVRDGGAIRAETASAAITGSDDARGVLSLVRHPSSWEGLP